MTAILTIPDKAPAHPSMDYFFLREEGLKYLSALGGGQWTDHNAHDPGITILEVLAYAITDLGYRASLPIEELLSDGLPDSLRRHFLTAERALPSAPVTESDYRKIFIDIPGVKNAWVLPHNDYRLTADCTASRITRDPIPSHHRRHDFVLKGIQDILIQPDESITEERSATRKKEKEDALMEAVRRVYHANRRLGEDLGDIRLVPMQDIRVCADVELHPEARIEQVYAQIHYRLQLHFNPPVRRYSLSEMLSRGKGVEEIYEGPLLQNGFVDDEELGNAALKTDIRTSDLIRVIMEIPGVKLVRKIHLNYCDAEGIIDADEEELWFLPVQAGHLPNLCEDKSRIHFYKGLLPFEIDRAIYEAEYARLMAAEREKSLAVTLTDKALPLPEPRYVDTADYTSIQHDLPRAYGVGRNGVPDVAPQQRELRQAQARQLRAYLLFFDQVLADYFVQLSQIRRLFEADASLGQTYFHAVVSDLPEIEEIYADYADLPTRLQRVGGEMEPVPDGVNLFTERKNRLLDHLMARFNENFSDYVLLMHTLNRRRRTDGDVLQEKTVFLNEYEYLSRNRVRAFDYYNRIKPDAEGKDLFDAEGAPLPQVLWYDPTNATRNYAAANIAGAEHRIGRLTGMNNVLRRNLSQIFYDIYEEFDTDSVGELRFRVIDPDNRRKVMLSGTRRYPTKSAAQEELRLAVRLAMAEQNYQFLTTSDGRFYFNIVEPISGDIVARRIEYFTSAEARATAVSELSRFLQEKYSEEGLYIVEHILLRPRKNADVFLPICTEPDCDACGPIDPYSYRVHVILPGYTPRFSDMDFRAFFDQTLRRELPAHLLPKICWIGKEQMSVFEVRYRAWLEAFRKDAHETSPDESDASLNALIDILNQLYSIYPEGYLHDCIDGDERNPIILGRTHIGVLSPGVEEDRP